MLCNALLSHLKTGITKLQKCSMVHWGYSRPVYVWVLQSTFSTTPLSPGNNLFGFSLKIMVQFSSATQSCPTLSGLMVSSPPGSTVHGISQERTLEWVAISFSRGFSRPRDWTHLSYLPGSLPLSRYLLRNILSSMRTIFIDEFAWVLA